MQRKHRRLAMGAAAAAGLVLAGAAVPLAPHSVLNGARYIGS